MATVLFQLLHLGPDDFKDVKDPYGWSPLHILANTKDRANVAPAMLKQLIAKGADLEATKGKGMTPILTAASVGNPNAVEVLALGGANAYHVNDQGTSAWDLTWNNHHVRSVIESMGAGEGAGVTGDGRLGVCKHVTIAAKS